MPRCSGAQIRIDPEIALNLENTQKAARPWSAAALVLLFAVVYGGAIFSPALLDDADATHAEAAREMAITGDYVTLHLNGVRYLEKAPLLYWSSALAMRLFGESAAAARLPMLLGIGLLALLLWRWAWR